MQKLLPLVMLLNLAMTAKERPDLSAASGYFCPTNAAVQKNLAAKPLSDAQIELALIQSERSPNLVAKEFAESNGHRGYGYGTCPDGKTFVVSTPAGEPVLEDGRKPYKLNKTALDHCRKYLISAIFKDRDEPVQLKELPKSPDKIQTLSVTCYPKDKAKSGPELWALVSQGEEKVEGLNGMPEFLNWVNERRIKLKYPSVTLSDKLNQLAQNAGTSSLAHPHSFLLKEKKRLAHDKIMLLGENRAISDSFSGLATLFWNSPEHRSLLLHANTNAIGYAISETKDQKTLVLILAKTEK